jgi:hypothetical protein
VTEKKDDPKEWGYWLFTGLLAVGGGLIGFGVGEFLNWIG